MAYFSCPTAALTGTDQATRISIAKGVVSPTFTDYSGKQVLRGVVQADVISGRNTGYATGQSIIERLAAAGRRLTSSTGGTIVYADSKRAAQASVKDPSGATSAPAQLHQGGEGTIQTTNTLGLSKKMIVGIIIGVIAIGVLVMR